MLGNKCACAACGGMPANGRVTVCVDCMVWPLATWTGMGLEAGWMLVKWQGDAKKCPVLPESRMMGGEGPSRADTHVGLLLLVLGPLGVLGFPRSYSSCLTVDSCWA